MAPKCFMWIRLFRQRLAEIPQAVAFFRSHQGDFILQENLAQGLTQTSWLRGPAPQAGWQIQALSQL